MLGSNPLDWLGLCYAEKGGCLPPCLGESAWGEGLIGATGGDHRWY
ncbi:hypothetical protein [Rubritalea tangerina]